MASLIASSTAQASSSDIVLTAGQNTSLYLTGSAGGTYVDSSALAFIQIKSGSQYYTIGQLDAQNPAKVLGAIGTFRVFKQASATAFGVDRDN